MDKKLNKEEIIKLISLYRSHDILWNMSSKSYRRNDLKEKAYEDIALQMGMCTDVVKKKIRSLRTTYTGEKHKIKKKSGSGSEEIYQPTLFWFEEMSFLDKSIVIRKSCDNSEKNSENSQDFVGCSEEIYNISNKQSSKRPREEDSKFDDALNKLLNISNKEDEFTAFATSLAFQLQKLPEEDAYELMGEMQNLLVQRKIKKLRCSRFRPISVNENSLNPAEYSAYNTPTSYSFDERSSTPLESSIPCSSANSDILSCAIFDADIEFEN